MSNSPYFLQLQNIEKRYNNGYIACSNINVEIKKGEFVTILGPSGCGKTTLLKMIAGFEMPTNGRVILNGIDIKDLPIHLRPTATVFQDYALFPNMTVYQNIIYGLKLMRTKLENVPQKFYRGKENVFKRESKLAEKQSKELRKQQTKIVNEIEKLKNVYLKKNIPIELFEMRLHQLQTQIKSYEKILAKKYKNPEGYKLTWNNKCRIFMYRIWKFFDIKNQKLSLDCKGMNEVEIKITNLISTYVRKSYIDRKVDKLRFKYKDLDEWLSYWQSYPYVQVENYEKTYITRPLNKQEIASRAQNVIELVGLQGMNDFYPSELSGGMQQRVALARAIVVEPEILLLDEPLSALDAKVRQKMQEELKRIHNELKITFILVTHDQEEALSLSNKIIVMSKGKIEQIGSAKNVYEQPKNEWVANFIGCSNLFDVERIDQNIIKIFDKKVENESIDKVFGKISKNVPFKIVVRPEDIILCELNEAFVDAKIKTYLYKGTLYEVKCELKNGQIISLQTLEKLKIGQRVGIKWKFEKSYPILQKGVKNARA